MRLSTVILIIGLLNLLLLGFYHEAAHVEIYAHDGIKSTIHVFKDFPAWSTEPTEPCKSQVCKLSNNLNEVVGYNLMAFYVLGLFGFWAIIRKLEDLCAK